MPLFSCYEEKGMPCDRARESKPTAKLVNNANTEIEVQTLRTRASYLEVRTRSKVLKAPSWGPNEVQIGCLYLFENTSAMSVSD